LLLSAPADPRSQSSEEPSASPEQSLSGGASRTHALTARGGDFIRVQLEHWELPLRVAVTNPSGHELARAEDANEAPMHLSAIADAGGRYEIAVTALGDGGKRARYRLVVDPPRPATDEDRQWVLAEQAQAEADRLAGEKAAESRARALERYREARERWRRLRQPRYEAEVLHDLGSLEFTLGASAEGRTRLEEALSLREALQDDRAIAVTLIQLGRVEQRAGNLRQALDHYERAGPLLAGLGPTRVEGTRLNNIGSTYWDMGEPRRSLEFLERSLSLRQQIGDRTGQATVLINIGVARRTLGERDRALAAYEEALPLVRAAKDQVGESHLLANLGALLLANGDPDGALQALSNAVELSRKTGDRDIEAYALGAVGRVLAEKKDYTRAVDLLSQALEARRAMKDRGWEGLLLLDLGRVHRLLGRDEEAAQALGAGLDLNRTVGDRIGEARALMELGKLHLRFGRREAAREALEQALAASRSTSPDSLATVHVDLAELEWRQGNLSAARQSAEAAIALFESLRGRITGSESRASFFVSAQEAYELELDLLAAQGASRGDEHLARQALEMSERKRGRSLLDSLAEARSEIVAGLPADLRRQEMELRDRLRTLTQRQQRLLAAAHTEEQAAGVVREIEEVVSRHQEVGEKLRAASPAYQAFLEGTTASASEVQQLLDEDTVLLEFSLGERASYVWVITRDRVEQASLPARAEVAARARACYEAFARPPGDRGPGSSAVAEAFSRMVLAPVAARLDRPRLAIVADGVLQHVPWAALPEPAGPHQGRPLIAAREIVLLPSASILKALRTMPRHGTGARKSVVVLADPVFEADDPRLGRLAVGPRRPEGGSRGGDLLRAARAAGFGDAGFPRLPFSRQEAQSIVATAPPGSSRSVLDFEASRETALSTAIQDFRIVHFATHGVIDDEHPSRSGLVLSLIDRQGRPQDGYLRLPDLYNLRLNADLVVLSACRSAAGRELRGEGLLSVVRAFMYAGAPRVVAAVWDVDDRPTAALMGRFYRAMLVKGRSPAAALREAQLAIQARAPWRDPFYWAGFVLQGEWM
jgi:CHAT domain-containing protein/Tfp pilus assembly protein PilF